MAFNWDRKFRLGFCRLGVGDSLKMAGVQDQLEIKFRLTDGSDIGPKTFAAATSVATLKESILTQWPKGELSFYFF